MPPLLPSMCFWSRLQALTSLLPLLPPSNPSVYIWKDLLYYMPFQPNQAFSSMWKSRREEIMSLEEFYVSFFWNVYLFVLQFYEHAGVEFSVFLFIFSRLSRSRLKDMLHRPCYLSSSSLTDVCSRPITFRVKFDRHQDRKRVATCVMLSDNPLSLFAIELTKTKTLENALLLSVWRL